MTLLKWEHMEQQVAIKSNKSQRLLFYIVKSVCVYRVESDTCLGQFLNGMKDLRVLFLAFPAL